MPGLQKLMGQHIPACERLVKRRKEDGEIAVGTGGNFC